MLFGTAVDPGMGDALSVTLVSSLPEEALQEGISADVAGGPSNKAKFEDVEEDVEDAFVDIDPVGEFPVEEPQARVEPEPPKVEKPKAKVKGKSLLQKIVPARAPRKMERTPPPEPVPEPPQEEEQAPFAEKEPEPEKTPEARVEEVKEVKVIDEVEEIEAVPKAEEIAPEPPVETGISDVTRRVKLPPKRQGSPVKKLDDVFSAKDEEEDEEDDFKVSDGLDTPVAELEEVEDAEVSPVGALAGGLGDEPDPEEDGDVVAFATVKPGEDAPGGPLTSIEELQAAADYDPKPQGELLLEGGPKGRFEGEDPNLVEGEDLDIPPFLRKKK
jgi:hypothetical protein